MKNMKRNAARLLLFAAIVAGVVFAALSVPTEANLIIGVLACLLLGVIFTVISRDQPVTIDSVDAQMDSIAASQEPISSGGRLAWTRLDDSTSKDESPRTLITPAFGFNLAPGLDRSHRQPAPMPTLYGLIDREGHPEFFGPLAERRHLKVVS